MPPGFTPALLDAPLPPPPYLPDVDYPAQPSLLDALVGAAAVGPPPPAPMAPEAPQGRAQPLYTAKYKDYPAYPLGDLLPMPAPPARDSESETANRNGATSLAALIPLLTAITGGNITPALGRVPGMMAEGVQGSTQYATRALEEAMQRYGIDRQNAQYANEGILGAYGADVDATRGYNTLETQKVNDAQQNVAFEETVRKNKENAEVKATQQGWKMLDHLAGLTPEGRQAEVARGLYARFGITSPEDALAIAKLHPSLVFTKEDELKYGLQKDRTGAYVKQVNEQLGINRDRLGNETNRTGIMQQDANTRRANQVSLDAYRDAMVAIGNRRVDLGNRRVDFQNKPKAARPQSPLAIQKLIGDYEDDIRKAEADNSEYRQILIKEMIEAGDPDYASTVAEINRSSAPNDDFIRDRRAEIDALRAIQRAEVGKSGVTLPRVTPTESQMRNLKGDVGTGNIRAYGSGKASAIPSKKLGGVSAPATTARPDTRVGGTAIKNSAPVIPKASPVVRAAAATAGIAARRKVVAPAAPKNRWEGKSRKELDKVDTSKMSNAEYKMFYKASMAAD